MTYMREVDHERRLRRSEGIAEAFASVGARVVQLETELAFEREQLEQRHAALNQVERELREKQAETGRWKADCDRWRERCRAEQEASRDLMAEVDRLAALAEKIPARKPKP